MKVGNLRLEAFRWKGLLHTKIDVGIFASAFTSRISLYERNTCRNRRLCSNSSAGSLWKCSGKV